MPDLIGIEVIFDSEGGWSWFRECLHNWCWPWSSKPSGGLNKAPSGFNSHTFPLFNFKIFSKQTSIKAAHIPIKDATDCYQAEVGYT
jgi:hypothetical protein